MTNLSVTVPEHNVIKVTCNEPKTLNGPAVKYIACLNDCSGTLNGINENCNFEFRDLSYSTTYTVKVCIILIFGFRILFHLCYFFKWYNS